MLGKYDTYEEIRRAFSWRLPERYNCAEDICDRHAAAGRGTALLFETEAGVLRHSYAELKSQSERLANALSALGLRRGDRVAIVAQPAFAVALAHIACWKSGLVSCAMATLFAADALAYRFRTSGARVVLTDGDNLDKVLKAASAAPELVHVILADGSHDECLSLPAILAQAAPDFENLATSPRDPEIGRAHV